MHKTKRFIISGTLLGIISGICLNKMAHQIYQRQPNQILNRVKTAFLATGSIEGSWIETKKLTSKKYPLTTTVYYGGITRYEHQQLVQYEFIADAKTGSVLDLFRL
ncbi:hypothetical protein [Loigolactobacillus iwatensis]|uniref:hypothetical protein n=1 Tax=Loigolactobacillus iwatensis TaxID=1267156 RepID=UPI000F7E226E|nr:hypothetical protein [Loigolactobacillus iwatensis]